MMHGQGVMREFLAASKDALLQLSSYQIIRVVLGNQTCDLDSAVSTLAQGVFEYIQDEGERHIAVIPVMNIPLKEFRTKTEVAYFLRYLNIPLNSLTFRDEIDLHSIQKESHLELILVDHHVLPNEDIALKSSVIHIFDHRPLNPNVQWPSHISILEQVGSCATLIARNILKVKPSMMDAQLANLLRGAILIDTYNLSEKAGLAKSIDLEIVSTLEHFGPIPDRIKLFNQIMDAKVNITELTFEEILCKDLKITYDVPIIVICMLIEDFLISRENAKEAIEKFSIDRNYNVIVLLGVEIKDRHVTRDIAIFTTLSDKLGDKITEALISSKEPYLHLTFIKKYEEVGYNLSLYKMGMSKLTRKQILPIVEKVALQQRNEEKECIIKQIE